MHRRIASLSSATFHERYVAGGRAQRPAWPMVSASVFVDPSIHGRVAATLPLSLDLVFGNTQALGDSRIKLVDIHGACIQLPSREGGHGQRGGEKNIEHDQEDEQKFHDLVSFTCDTLPQELNENVARSQKIPMTMKTNVKCAQACSLFFCKALQVSGLGTEALDDLTSIDRGLPVGRCLVKTGG